MEASRAAAALCRCCGRGHWAGRDHAQRAAVPVAGGLRFFICQVLKHCLLPAYTPLFQANTLENNKWHGWQDHGVEEQAVTVRDMERNGQTLDVTVAARPLQPGCCRCTVPTALILGHR